MINFSEPLTDLKKLEDRDYKISEVADLLQISPRALRYWQENDLIIPHGSMHSSERIYKLDDVKRAQHIKELQGLFGFSLNEIKQILQIEDKISNLKQTYLKDSHNKTLKNKLGQSALTEITSLMDLIDKKIDRINHYRNDLNDKVNLIKGFLKNG